MADIQGNDQFVIRQQVFTLFAQKFHVYDSAGKVVMFCQQKAFKLREDIRLYADDSKSQEVMAIRTPHVLDFGATYEVVDSPTGRPIGSVQRKGLKSMLRDEWSVYDVNGREVAKVREDSTGLAILRRIINDYGGTILLPQRFHLESNDGGGVLARFSQNRNPFVRRLTIDLSGDRGNVLDRRLVIAIGLLLSAIEGKQN
jgi:hypothetical protein